MVKLAKTKQDKEACTKSTGVRYTELLRLSYYKPIRFVAIDPMHNLFLGTAKHVPKTLWIDEEFGNNAKVLPKAQLRSIQTRIDSVKPPSRLGKLSLKIASSFSGFKTEQWKSWTTVYSPFALRDLPSPHLNCWLDFVASCRILCNRVLTNDDVDSAHYLLQSFCEMLLLYGDKAATPNLHLHMHLRETLLDFGPVYGFWLFGFERFNGILGSYKTNNRDIESQIMRNVLEVTQAYSYQSSNAAEMLDKFRTNACLLLPKRHVGSLGSS